MKLVLRDFTYLLAVAILSFVSLTSGCKSKSKNESNPQTAAQNTNPGQQNPAQQLSVDDLVAPIALYPDRLLAQVLTTAVNPQEVLDLGNWLLQNQNLTGDAMSNAAKQAGFSPSAQYLALFPQVVDNMCQQMDWTRQLGEAFKADQKGVMDAVQRKRVQAEQMGNLQSSPQMTVENKKSDSGQPYVEIKPTNPEVVYVPQYNPVTIYNTTAPAAPAQTTTATTTTTTEEKSGISGGEAAAIGLLSFGVGMALGSAIHHDDYYPYPAWGYGGVYVGPRPYYPAAYRAPVYAGYRPAYGYNPPGNYRWNQYNRNVNTTINNNYYNRFNTGNVNNRANTYNQNRPVQNQSNNFRGQSTYQGARNNNNVAGQKPGASMANAVPRNQQYGGGQRNQAAAGGQRTQMAANRPETAASRPSSMAGNAGAGGGIDRSNASAASSARASAPSNVNRGGDRGYSSPSSSGASARTAGSSSPPDRSGGGRVQSASASGGGAFGGGTGGSSGRQERAASSRGRESMGGSSARASSGGGSRGGGRRR